MHILLAFGLVVGAFQDPKPPPPPPAPAEKPAVQDPEGIVKTIVKRLTIGGQVRFRAEYRNPTSYANTTAAEDRDIDLFMSRIRLNFKADVTDDVEVFIQPQDQRIWGEEASVLTDQKNLDLH